jgi:ankyrin repeat protein
MAAFVVRLLGGVLLALACAPGALGALAQDVERDDDRAVRRAIESREATPDTRVPAAGYDEPGIPILALAARAGSVRVVRLLVSLKADLNAKTPAGETPLMLASFIPDESGEAGEPATTVHYEIVRLLVEAGAPLENPGQLTAAGYAAYAGHMEILRYLLDRGAAPDGSATGGVARVPTPLTMAMMQGRTDAARLLLERGADPRIKTAAGDDALTLARKLNRTDLVPMLECAAGLAPGQRFAEFCARR